jgi:uncharacterized protein YhaN
MKILTLKLDAFGPFTDYALDLDAGQQGLQMIYGANEAGKTSALRAIRQLFYGIPTQSPDNFIHEYRAMRLGATLERGDGTRLQLVRFKRTRNPLCREDAQTPLDPSQLEQFLGGVDQDLFSTLFGIDHHTLVKGGKEIAEGGGRLGNVLFAASSGISNLRPLQEHLRTESDELFKPGGRNQRIPKAISELRDAQNQIKSLQLPSDRWARSEQARCEALSEKDRLDARWREKDRESSRLTRIRSALPLISERAQIVGELEQYRDAVPLREDFPEARRKAQMNLASAAQETERARRALAELSSRRDEIVVPEALLAAEDDIELLRNQRAAHLKAQADRPQLEMFLQDNEHAAREILQSLGKPRDLAAAELLRLRVDEPGRITQLGRDFTKLTTRWNEARTAIGSHGESLRTLERQLAAQGKLPDVTPLGSAVKNATKEGDLEARRAEDLVQIARQQRGLSLALGRLPAWSASLEDLEELAVPLPETVMRYEAELQAAATTVRDQDVARTNLEKAIGEVEAKIHEHAMELDVPTEDDLREGRRARDTGWSLIRRVWLDQRDDPAAEAAFIAQVAPGRTLAEAYEKAVLDSDALSDRLRREADRVARKVERLTRLDQYQTQLVQLTDALNAALSQRDKLQREWDALLASLVLSGLSPPELRSWMSQRDRLIDQLRQVRERQADVGRIDVRISHHRDRVATCLGALTGQTADPEETLSSLIELAGAFLADHQTRAKNIERLDAQRAKEAELQAGATLRLKEIEADLEALRRPWTECMARIGLGPQATPEQADVFLSEIAKLFGYLEKAKGFRSRMEGIDRDAAKFAADVAALVDRIAPELAGAAPADAAEKLSAMLRLARQVFQKERSLAEQIETETKKHAAAEKAHTEAILLIESLCREAGCAGADDLPAVEERSARRRGLEDELKRCEGQIREHSAGATVEAFAREVFQLDRDSLDHSIKELEEELSGIQQKLEAVNQAIGSARTQLDQMDGSSKAAEANETAGFALAQLQEDVPRYAALRIASWVLQQGIERYRERNQGPVLARASEIFAALTMGWFERLRIELDDHDETVIMGVRPGGRKTVGVEGMSTGAHAQLYLAIRIAYLETWLTGHEPIPFIVDDILIDFDDNRGVAALKVLADLSRRTQVIFFTHNAHILKLAQDCLPADALFPQFLIAGSPP